MQLYCPVTIVKYTLFLFNFLISIIGISLVVVGILHIVGVKEVRHFLPPALQTVNAAPIIAIVIGCIIFLIAFLGCCGALLRSAWMLSSFASVLLIIFIVQVGIGLYVVIQLGYIDEKLKIQIQSAFQSLINRYYNVVNSSKDIIDTVQKKLKCCGGAGENDYGSNPIPSSCCISTPIGTGPCVTFDSGCADKIYEYFWKVANITKYVAISTAIVEIVSSVLAFLLACCTFEEPEEEDDFRDSFYRSRSGSISPSSYRFRSSSISPSNYRYRSSSISPAMYRSRSSYVGAPAYRSRSSYNHHSYFNN